MSTHFLSDVAGLTGERVTIALPRDWKRAGAKPAVIVCPGTSEDAGFPFQPAIAQPLITALTDAGFPVGCVTPINRWGNDNARNWFTRVRTLMQSPAYGAKAGKVGLVGLSQGGLNVLSWAGANPTLVGAVTTYLAPCDLSVAAAAAGYGAAVNAAYGGTYNDSSQGAAYNPQRMAEAGKYAGIPIELVYASNDAVVPLPQMQTFKNTVGANALLRNGGATGHEWAVTRTAPAIVPALLAQMNGV